MRSKIIAFPGIKGSDFNNCVMHVLRIDKYTLRSNNCVLGLNSQLLHARI